ncbi:hypothetical protein Hanom_Chr11g01046641 [Helianthus anomalus]
MSEWSWGYNGASLGIPTWADFHLGGRRFDSRLRHTGGGSPNDGSFLPRHGAVLRATRFYSAVTPASLSCGGRMVSGRKSAFAMAGARSNIASVRAGLTGKCL